MKDIFWIIAHAVWLIVLCSCGDMENDPLLSDHKPTLFANFKTPIDAAPSAPMATVAIPVTAITSVETEYKDNYWVFTIYATHNDTDYVSTVQRWHGRSASGFTELDDNAVPTGLTRGYRVTWELGSDRIETVVYDRGNRYRNTHIIDLTNFSLATPIDDPVEPVDDPVDPIDDPVEPIDLPTETPVINNPQLPIRHSPRSAYNFRIMRVEKFPSRLLVHFQNIKNQQQGNILITRAYYEVAYQTDQQKQNGVSLSWKTAAYDHESSFGIYHLKPETLYHIHLRAVADTFNEVTSASGKIELETSTTAQTAVVTYIVFVECEEIGIEGGSVAEQHAKVESADGKIYLHSGANGNFVSRKEIVAYKKGVLYADLTEEIVALMEKHENACD